MQTSLLPILCSKKFCLIAATASVFFLLWTSSQAFAQNSQTGRITGKISDAQNQPIEFANISLDGTSRGAVTSADGSFELTDVPAGEYILKVSSVGFVTIRQNIALEQGQSLTLTYTFEEDINNMPQVTIIAHKDRLFSRTPGSVSYVGDQELRLIQALSGNEVFRRVSGLHVVDEEGLGLRTNIGIRGLNPDRSRNVLMLEDGVPVALNPYGEPEMYYTPAMDRMAGVEVVKGSGQILYGPQTIGGVINYITANPPESEETRVKIQGGQGGLFTGLVSYGNTINTTGFHVSYLRKQASDIGATEFGINDLSAKVSIEVSDRAKLGLKLGVYNEISNATYIGLTQPMYDAGGQDFVRIAPDDQLDVRRYSLSTTYEYALRPNTKFQTLLFGYTTTRNWRRQDFSSSASASNQTGVVWGDPAVAGGALYMRNSTGNRDRQFEVMGVEPRILHNYSLGSIKAELVAGARFMHEKAYEQSVNGTKSNAKSGALVLDEERTGLAYSAFLQNQLNVTDKLSVTPGLRYEIYDYEREIFRNQFTINGASAVRDTLIVGGSNTYQLIPGIGLLQKFTSRVNMFAGVHRGFAPPRVKDAIANSGESLQLKAENSWNYELGIRTSPAKGVFVEATAFLLDFSNQIIPVSESSGGTGTGLVNGGRTQHQGVEVAVNWDIAQSVGSKWKLQYDINSTFVNATFSEDRFQTVADELVNINGNRTPYAPKTTISSALTVGAPAGLDLRLTSTYVSGQFGDELNTLVPAANGRTGYIDSYFIMDGTVTYGVDSWNTVFNLSAKNIFDERAIVSRRPQGIRVNLPRYISAGFDIRF